MSRGGRTHPLFTPAQVALTPAQVALILEHIHHTQDLDIVIANTSADVLFEGLVISAPMLKNVHLVRESDGLSIPLPDELLGGNTPTLRTLRVNGFNYFPWTSGILSASFVDLSIDMSSWTDRPIDGSTLAYCETMLDAFERMPALERLELEQSFLNQHKHTMDGGRMVPLPHLRPSILMIVRYDDDYTDETGFAPIVSIVTSSLAGGSELSGTPPIKSLYIENKGGDISNLCVEACRLDDACARLSAPKIKRGTGRTITYLSDCEWPAIHVDFGLGYVDEGDDSPNVRHIAVSAEDIWARVPWASLERFTVALWAKDGVALNLSWEGLRKAAHLETLQLHGPSAVSFCEFLKKADKRKRRQLLPALKKIKLYPVEKNAPQPLLELRKL
ncbi:hypothetical protein FA95DRAFT_1678261 [Auriscalpium vulgare]|uniref:Uncharacterized protein n=1 Tax=Auriscalpium vulgare TaxID=40419 RepID=A0ACB8RXD8_9AGAM|nr:hypothetical protein FA95DRAFT_1678261 [Auriscalpium vulgare]